MNPEIQAILDRHVQEIAHVTGAVVVSEDGVFQYMSGWPATPTSDPSKTPEQVRQEHGEHRAAMASSLVNLAQRIAALDDSGAAQRVMIETEHGWNVTSRSGEHSAIALSAAKDAALGQLGYQLALLAEQLGPLLDVERHKAAPGQAL